MKDDKKKRPQPAWSVPTGSFQTGLKVANSLALEAGLVPFVPAQGRRVGWYICGPTTYDSSHLGHARNYVTFDVIRRIMSDYFNYEVFSVMNITDVDDKIILKARREVLFAQFSTQNAVITEEVLREVRAALDGEVSSCTKKIAEVATDEEKSEAERAGEARLLQKRIDVAKELLEKDWSQYKVGQPSQALLSRARDALSVSLDSRLKESVGNLDVRPLASRYEKEYLEDMQTLGVRMPDALTRVSEYIPQIIAYVEKIIANGYGYVSNGSVYFDTDKYLNDGQHDYGKLAPSKVGNARAQEEADGALSSTTGKADKKNGNDFVLWKKSKPGEPVWESPWGLGRPGWHIECSAMASELLGQTLDVHSGGQDLYFPHHENEIAQCEAYFHDKGCKQWVNYFFHSGHLHIDGLKMSKSLKNFITIREALQPPYSYTPRQLRLFFVTRAWNKEVNFDAKTMEEVFAMERTIDSFFATVASVARVQVDAQTVTQAWNSADMQLNRAILEASDAVHAGFCDNFDTRAVIKAIIELAKAVNQYVQDDAAQKKSFLLNKAAAFVTRILRVIGLVPDGDALGWTQSSGSGSDELVTAFYNFRQGVRDVAKGKQCDAAALLNLTDDLRDRVLPPLGLKFDDSELGWKRVDPKKAMAEIQERKRLELQKLEKRLLAAQQDLSVLERGNASPQSVIDKAEFSAFDETGFPTKMADGSEIPKSKQKTLKKAWSAQEKAQEKFLAKANGNPEGLLADARQRVADLQVQVDKMKQTL